MRSVSCAAELGTSTVELALFFTLVAAILGAVVLFLNGTLPQIFAAARLANSLENATVIKPRLGSLVIHSSPIELRRVPDLSLAEDDPSALQALSTEVSELSGVLGLAFPYDSERPSVCLDVYQSHPGECDFEQAVALERFNAADACSLGQSNPCVITQANALLAARGCAESEPEAVLLTVMYPAEGAFLKSPCAVIETGFPRVIQK